MTAPLTGRIGLIGDPVEHSLSPAFQQAAFDALGIDTTYELLHTPAEEIPERASELRSGQFFGVNVTVPHKEAFFNVVDELSTMATRIGAVNTIICRNGRLVGDNTDVHGFTQSLVNAGFSFPNRQALVLGAGGASRAVVVGLLESGIERVILANRTLERAQAIVNDLGDARITPVTLREVNEYATESTLVVNATSLGWQRETLPVDRGLFSQLPDGAIAYDLTYQKTVFLDTAAEHGIQTIDGFAMLVLQGATSFELWTGQPAPLDVMWEAANAARS